jgi:hypothetical protein
MSATHCENCGRESHCGGQTTMKVNAHEVGVYEVVICKHCRCDKCTEKKDPKNEL